MAQFYWTANPADIGGPPSDLGIVQPWDPFTSITVVDERQQTVFPVAGFDASLELVLPGGAARRLAAFVSVGGVAVPDSADAEIWMHFVANGSGNETRNALRADPNSTTATATALTGGLRRSIGSTENGQYSGGTFSALTAGPGGGQDIYMQRVRAEGASLLTRVWPASDPEPSGWTVVSNGVAVLTPGAVGFFQFSSDANWRPRIVALGIGTDGDSAPDEAPTAPSGMIAAMASPRAAGPVAGASGLLRQTVAATGSGPVATAAANGEIRLSGPATGLSAAPTLVASGIAGTLPMLAARLAGPVAGADGRLRVSGPLALPFAAPRFLASAHVAIGGVLAPTAGRSLRPAATGRHGKAVAIRRMLVPEARRARLTSSSEEINNG